MFGLITVYAVGFAVLLFYLLKIWFEARRVWEQYGSIPGRRTFIRGSTPLGNLTREVKYITSGRDKCWKEKHEEYKMYGWDALSAVSLWPKPQGELSVVDADAIKIIFSSRLKFPKALEKYGLLSFFGTNVLTAEFDDWKRHRKITAPAFTEKNTKLAFEESVRAITSLYEGVWHDEQEVLVENVLGLTMEAALMIISAAAFGRRTGWGEDDVPPGHRMSFKRAIGQVGTGILVRVLCPKWIFEWGPIETIRECRDSFDELRSYLLESIDERKYSDGKGEKRDLLSNLLNANDEVLEDGERRLGEAEVIGNMFMFYIAGHETTGHTLSFTLSMLAVYQEEQEALYRHIQEVLPDGRLPTYEDTPRLNRVMAALYETLRMFPPGPEIPKYSVENTSLVIGNGAGETTVIPVPAGTRITIDVPGLHYNPRYWDDPHTFKPERFMGKYNKDAFVPFSGGMRICIGRGFFDATALGMLTTLVQRYKIEPHPKFAGESFGQLKERYSEATGRLTLTPLCTALVFKKRA